MPITWSDPAGVRIWRGPARGTTADDVLTSAAHYHDDVLARIAGEGFTGIWVFCELYSLMHSTVFVELNRPRAARRRSALRSLIDRARRHGLGVYLYFNEPMGVRGDHPFWVGHPELRGATKWQAHALCTSVPVVREFFGQALESVFRDIPGVAGVILITGSEGLTHCWSKHTRRPGDPPPECTRCRPREPADIVLELLHIWAGIRRKQPQPFRILAWNWEWTLWYPDPQAEIVSRLPAGVELLLGFEMTGTRQWHGRTIPVGEYAFSYPGPCNQFVETCALAAAHGIPVHTKIELSLTHEICSVPNVPVLRTLHRRFATMNSHRIAGVMACWTMTRFFTLNTFSMRLFLRDPCRFMDRRVFLDALAREYFGCTNTDDVIRAWELFSDAFLHYPFNVQLLYRGPHNDAPGRRLSLHFTGIPIGRSFMPDPPGDDLGCLTEAFHVDRQAFSLNETIEGFTVLHDEWMSGLRPYLAALDVNAPALAEEHRVHRREETSCAAMIGLQTRSIVNVLRFYQAQQQAMQAAGLKAPCDIPPNPTLLNIMEDELDTVRQALPLVEEDQRLGYVHDIGGCKYDAVTLRAKICCLEEDLDAVAGSLPQRNPDSHGNHGKPWF